MWFFYLMCLIPLAVGAYLWYTSERVVWWEWISAFLIALTVAGIFQLCCNLSLKNNDTETWSGQVTSARQFSAWKEYYEEAIYRTEYYYETEYYTTSDSKGRTTRRSRRVQHSRRVFDHWESRNRWHREYWVAYTTLNDISIDQSKYVYLTKKFNSNDAVPGDRRTGEHNSRMIDGDPNDYVASNTTDWIEPVTTTKTFENRIKAAPSVFSFIKVPTNINVHPWPENPNPFVSQRLMGTACVLVDQLKWDQMNAKLGPDKKVNVIMVGFGNKDAMMGQYQQAKWIGGRKNDLVLCFGGGSKKEPASWAFVFGWSEKELVKRRLESLLLNTPINNDILPLIENEIRTNYEIKDWHKFDYIKVEPPTWSYVVFLIVLTISQVGAWYGFMGNTVDKMVSRDYYKKTDWSWFKMKWHRCKFLYKETIKRIKSWITR